MKTIKHLLLLACFAPAFMYAQVDRTEHDSQNLETMVSDDGYTVPDAVRLDFEERYPNSEVTNLFTSEEKYTIEFEKDGKTYTTFYDTQNHWLKTHEHMDYANLPEQAKKSFMGTPYSDYKVDQVSKVQNGNNEIYYEMSIQNKGTSRNLYLDSEGTLMDELNQESPQTYR